MEHADVVKLADTLDLGSSAYACRFESCRPHHLHDTVIPKGMTFFSVPGEAYI